MPLPFAACIVLAEFILKIGQRVLPGFLLPVFSTGLCSAISQKRQHFVGVEKKTHWALETEDSS